MLTRIVKLSIRPEHVNDFIATFESRKTLIASSKGCSGVELLRDIDKPHIFFTYSKWMDEESLERYREAELFKTTWKEVKQLFSDKPEAWSVKNIG